MTTYPSLLIFTLIILFHSSSHAVDIEEFKDKIEGKTVKIYHNKKDITFKRYFSKGGKLLDFRPNQSIRQGSWKIKGDNLCFQISKAEKCRKILLKGDTYGTANKKGNKIRAEFISFEKGNTIGEASTPAQHLDLARPIYQGVISDSHTHIIGGMKLESLIDLMNENNVDTTMIMRRETKRFADTGVPYTTNEELLNFKIKYPDRIKVGYGMQVPQWKNQDASFPDTISDAIDSGQYSLIGEIVLHGSRGGSNKTSVSPSSLVLKAILDMAAQHALPVIIHQFHIDISDENDFVSVLENHTDNTIIWAHMCGNSPTTKIRQLLDTHPNLYCDLTWLQKKRTNPDVQSVDNNFNFTPEWKNLIEDYPDRFMIGTDLTTSLHYKEDYTAYIERARIALGALKPDTAQKVATDNFHRLYPAP